MRRIQLHDYVNLGGEIHTASLCVGREKDDQIRVGDFDPEYSLYAALLAMRKVCERLGARDTRTLLEGRSPSDDKLWEQVKPKNSDDLNLLVEQFKRELKDRVFLYMPAADAEFYQSRRLLTQPAKSAFPGLSQELRLAGNAYACGLATASVFHCMRALEHALGALAVDVGLRWEKEQWHNIIEQIEARIRDLNRTLPMGLAKDERINFLSQAAKEFMYFKDGWRNYVAHNRITYGQDDALEVIEHVQAFTEKLSANLRE